MTESKKRDRRDGDVLVDHRQVLVKWMKDRIEPSGWRVTTTNDIYADYVAYFKTHGPSTEEPLSEVSVGVLLSQFFGKVGRKRIGGRVRHVRALVIKESS